MRRPLRSDEARGVANLAIDLGDPGRMARARRMHRANAVAEVDIVSGAARATVTDAEGELHDVDIVISAPPVTGHVPAASDVETSCTCDDDGDTCTHALASLLGIAEEIETNGRLLELWTGKSGAVVDAPKYVAAISSENVFFHGAWPDRVDPIQLSPIRLADSSSLVVDDVDAGPVVRDAVGAIRSGLTRYRVRS